MARSFTVKSGTVTAKMDDIGAALLERLLEDVSPGMLAEIDAEVSDVLANAVSEWPRSQERDHQRRPLRSADQFSKEIVMDLDAGKLWGRIMNATDYWFYIRALSLAGKNPASLFVRRPMKAAAARIGERFVRAMSEGGLSGR